MSTCWHGNTGYCSICHLICGENHLGAVKKREKENELESYRNRPSDGCSGSSEKTEKNND